MTTQDTEKLRARIELTKKVQFWGQEYTITPRLIGKVFGDGAQLICITPLATRPNYFVVRVDSSPTFDVRSILDDIITAAEEEYGSYDRDSEEDDNDFPRCAWSIGCCWGDRFSLPKDPPKRRRRTA
jgi:hypothetical protein